MLAPRWLVFIVAVGGCLGAASLAAPAQSLTAQAQPLEPDIPARLAAICERLSHGPNTYFSDGLAGEVEHRLAELISSGDAVPREELVGTAGLLGRELMKLGRTKEAVDQLEWAYQLVVEHELQGGVRDAVHWHLALAHLQYAEDRNCVEHRTADRCLLPVRAGGVHGVVESTRRAGDLFLDYAHRHPRNVQAGWLLNLARRLSNDFPDGVPPTMRLSEQTFAAEEPFPEWRDVGPELGISGDDLAGGAVMDDFDGDGFLDLVSSTWDPCDHLKAWRNDGAGGFEDVTEAWGLSGQLGGLNLFHADYDNDGRLDLLVLRGAWLLTEGRIPKSLLRNVAQEGGPGGGMRFEDVTVAAGLGGSDYPSQAAAWGDVDNDGDLDLYIGNEATEASPYPSQLFLNRGDGTFVDVAISAGVTNLRYAKAVAFGDADNDGDLDLYVSNFGENRFYRNDLDQGSLRFVDIAPELGVTSPELQSFPTWFFDYDNDGDLDLFVADYVSRPAAVSASYFGIEAEEGQPLLHRNDLDLGGGLRFVEVSRQVGLRRPAMPMGANFGDLDNDGWLDLYLGTGEPDLASLMPNQVYRNHEGVFSEVTFAGRFGHLQKGHGVAFGDVDNDGDQDVFHQLGGFYPGDSFGNALMINPLYGGSEAAVPAAAAPHWLVLQLRGQRANRFGVGARVAVRLEHETGERTIHAVVGSGGSFGASSLQLELGLGAAKRVLDVEIRWPGGEPAQRLGALAMDRVYRVVEGAEPVMVERRRIRLGR